MDLTLRCYFLRGILPRGRLCAAPMRSVKIKKKPVGSQRPSTCRRSIESECVHARVHLVCACVWHLYNGGNERKVNQWMKSIALMCMRAHYVYSALWVLVCMRVCIPSRGRPHRSGPVRWWWECYECEWHHPAAVRQKAGGEKVLLQFNTRTMMSSHRKHFFAFFFLFFVFCLFLFVLVLLCFCLFFYFLFCSLLVYYFV